MKDIREQIFNNYSIEIDGEMRSKSYIDEEDFLTAMDEYALLILQWLNERRIEFGTSEPFDAKVFLEEIKTELT